jgi:polysaccharide deacetylase family protein (PEP-CTERM system associated)
MKNALTIDLEDYFHVSAFADLVDQENWHSQVSRIEANTNKVLDLLDIHGRRATFFTLAWVAKQHPHLVKKIADQGHEIACHSLRHQKVFAMRPEEFREDCRRAKELLEDVSGKHVRGYRAPSFSIDRSCGWAFDVLAESGFTYDSSIFPVRHPSYGIPDAPRFPFLIETPSGNLVEFPMPSLSFLGWRSPLGGGAYLRLLPYWYSRWGIRFLNRQEGMAVCVYLHPWELDPEQPRMNGSLTARLRHYLGLRSTERKLQLLLRDFEFVTLGELASAYSEMERGRVTDV